MLTISRGTSLFYCTLYSLSMRMRLCSYGAMSFVSWLSRLVARHMRPPSCPCGSLTFSVGPLGTCWLPPVLLNTLVSMLRVWRMMSVSWGPVSITLPFCLLPMAPFRSTLAIYRRVALWAMVDIGAPFYLGPIYPLYVFLRPWQRSGPASSPPPVNYVGVSLLIAVPLVRGLTHAFLVPVMAICPVV